jgi:hypothetical protein
MVSLVRDSRTVVSLKEVRINQGLAPELFEESALAKGPEGLNEEP